jgi:hypothetical protein
MDLMPSIKTFRGTMDSTRTYSRRWWLLIPTPAMPFDAILLLGQVKDKSYEVDEQTYGVLEIRSAFPKARAFVVRKCGAELGGDDEQYLTTIAPAGGSCTCKAGKTRQEICRHRDGIRAAILAGALPKRELQGA